MKMIKLIVVEDDGTERVAEFPAGDANELDMWGILATHVALKCTDIVAKYGGKCMTHVNYGFGCGEFHPDDDEPNDNLGMPMLFGDELICSTCFCYEEARRLNPEEDNDTNTGVKH